MVRPNWIVHENVHDCHQLPSDLLLINDQRSAWSWTRTGSSLGRTATWTVCLTVVPHYSSHAWYNLGTGLNVANFESRLHSPNCSLTNFAVSTNSNPFSISSMIILKRISFIKKYCNFLIWNYCFNLIFGSSPWIHSVRNSAQRVDSEE